MKEIDLLPEWYKTGRRQQAGYRTQYVVLGCLFVVIMAWNFITAGSVSKAAAKSARAELEASSVEGQLKRFAELKNEVAGLQEKADILQEIDSRIKVGNVLAELSFLVNERIVLSEVALAAERFAANRKSQAAGSSAVKVVRRAVGNKAAAPLGDVRFKVVISGVAASAADVANLIYRMEESSYFQQVYLVFSRNKKLKQSYGLLTEDKGAKEKYRVSEFKIDSYLANYQEL